LIGVGLAVAVLLGRAAPPPLPAVPPPVERRAPAAAVAALLDLAHDPGGVVAFGELHQTRATATIRSTLGRFTDEILPVLAPHAAHLIVETWITTGRCGESEARVTDDVARTTERPAETENEIVKLLRRAKELGVAPHVLDIGCDEYKVLAGGGGSLDYEKLLTITNTHLERAIRQALALPRAPGRTLVVVYGGALHNDLYPDPTLARFTFGRAIFALTRGAYREIDLYVPALIDALAALKAEPWYAAWSRASRARAPGRSAARDDDAFLVRRSARSAIVIWGRGK
jgi:hypothetical protein